MGIANKGGILRMENVLETKGIEKYYGNKSNLIKAIDNISFEVKRGEFVGIMGASGSRKNNPFKLYNCFHLISIIFYLIE